ncbi:hypothetical protein P817_02142 [Klebsiella aerogenes UCI 15]|jgi:hypothetical protein|nr:hypothetical protein P817_02142 [Klebsiella aerogenes UCI 15]DAN89158.1 MAG TPA: hypothetical protein [Caudoviricetes sp.]
MSIFWPFWIPFNFIFWWYITSQVDNANAITFCAGTGLAIITGIVPFVLWIVLKRVYG